MRPIDYLVKHTKSQRNLVGKLKKKVMKMNERNIKDRSVCVDMRNTATRDVT